MKRHYRSIIGIVFSAFLFFSMAPSADANGFFKYFKTKVLKKYASCYKASKKDRDACWSTCDSAVDKIEETREKLRKAWLETTDQAMRKRYADMYVDYAKSIKKRMLEYDKCVDTADKKMLKCRLGKGHFKDGCDQSEMRSDLAALAKKENDIREMAVKCENDCKDEFDEMVASKPKKATKSFKKFEKCYKVCADVREKDLRKHAAYSEKRKMEVLKKCISLGKRSK